MPPVTAELPATPAPAPAHHAEAPPSTLGKRHRTGEKARFHHLSKQLQTRLQYAKLKVEHGWTKQTLNEVENLYFHHYRSRQPTATSLAAAQEEKRRKERAAAQMLGLPPEMFAGMPQPGTGEVEPPLSPAPGLSTPQSQPPTPSRPSTAQLPSSSAPTPHPPSAPSSTAPVPLPSRTPLLSSSYKPASHPSSSTPSTTPRHGPPYSTPTPSSASISLNHSNSAFSLPSFPSPLQSRSNNHNPQALTYDNFWSNHTSAALTAASLRERARRTSTSGGGGGGGGLVGLGIGFAGEGGRGGGGTG